MDGVADLGRGQTLVPARDEPGAVDGPQADHPLGIEPVRTAVEERERRVREPPQDNARRSRHRRELRQHGRRRRRALGGRREELELRRLGHRLLRSRGQRPVDAEEEPGLAALELLAAVAVHLDLEPARIQWSGAPASRRLPGSTAPLTISRSIARVIAT